MDRLRVGDVPHGAWEVPPQPVGDKDQNRSPSPVKRLGNGEITRFPAS